MVRSELPRGVAFRCARVGALFVGVVASGCGNTAASAPALPGASTSAGSAIVQPSSPSASAVIGDGLADVAQGFVELPRLHYELLVDGTALPLQAPAARLFYRFARAARAGPASRRLCLYLAGGPGLGNERAWLDLGPRAAVPLSTVCHALFLDPRSCGLSYQLVGSAPYSPDAAEYNAYMDAIDHTRALSVLLNRLSLSGIEELVLMGESYGGVRATLMLNLLRKGATGVGVEASLTAPELDEALSALGSQGLTDVGHYRQVLIQPTLAGKLQDLVSGELLRRTDSVVYELATQAGITLPTCGVDCDAFSWMLEAVATMGKSPYDYRAPASWLDDELARARRYAQATDGLGAELQFPALLDDLYASRRADAFRVSSALNLPEEAGDWALPFGSLTAVDRYFVSFNTEVFDVSRGAHAETWGASAFESRFGALFVENMRDTPTFITRAQFDLVNYSPSFGPLLQALPGVQSAELDEADGQTRPGTWRVTLADGSVVSVRAPSYETSHAVSRDMGAPLLEDVLGWIE